MQYDQGDQVLILTTKNVIYISHRPGETPNPNGIWTMAAGVDGNLMLTKMGVTIVIPPSDVQMYGKRAIDTLDQQLKGIFNG